MRNRLYSLFIMILLAGPVLAGPTATLTGRVTDTSGAVIAAVRVEATNVETNVVFSGVTNGDGRYTIPDLPPGIYRVIVRKFAFRTIVKPDVELRVQDVVALNFSMELGSISQSVTVEPGAPLIQAGPQRGGAFVTREVSELPLLSLSPISLARALPGVIEPRGTQTYLTVANDESTLFIVNGARNRGNNYLLDTVENNDLVYTGVAQPFNITDAVEEVSVQTGNYGVEFGRASGGVFNIVTKSGTNALNGTILGRYQSELFNSVSNLDRLTGAARIPFDRQLYGFTTGGPVRKDKTFFFGAFQQDNFRSRHYSLVVPTESAIATLRALFPLNPRLDTYLKYLGNLRGTADPFSVQLGRDPITRNDRGTVQFATAALDQRETNAGPQWMLRLDHNRSDQHRLTLRYLYDSRIDSPAGLAYGLQFPGFSVEQAAQNQNVLLSDQYTLSPTWMNEFRFSYARQYSDQSRLTPDAVPEAMQLPRISIAAGAISAPGVGGITIQFRRVNNFLFQDTLTSLRGRHTLRYGAELLRQFATENPAARFNGEIPYSDALGAGYSAFANFLDDFSGVGGPQNGAQKDFAPGVFHPNSLRQTYFLQDAWLPAPGFSVTLGLRYENFGQPANSLRYPAFSDFDPIFKPNRVNTDNNNFGPAFGLAWSPSVRSGLLRHLFGENKTVWRGGYQISYEGFFTQSLSLLLATATPNGVSWTLPLGNTGRGTPNWSEQLPKEVPPKSILDTQRGALDKNLRNAYTERWSFGVQRQISNDLLIDGSYVGSESHKLLTWIEVNPIQPGGARLHPDFGARQIRTGDGNSAYHAMQWRVDRRFARGFQVAAAYTWSRTMDSTSEGAGTVSGGIQSPQILQAGVKRERGLSDFHRSHRLSISYVWSLPTVRNRLWTVALGGWSLAGITSFQSGAPFTVTGRRSNVTLAETLNRPDISNPNAPLNTRAILSEGCNETGYKNPDTNLCVSPADVHWIQGSGPLNAATVGRNTLQAGSVFNFDLSLSKSFQIAEQKKLEFRLEAMNAFNHPQFIRAPARDVINAAPGRFLNPDFTDSGIRSMWLQLKLRF